MLNSDAFFSCVSDNMHKQSAQYASALIGETSVPVLHRLPPARPGVSEGPSQQEQSPVQQLLHRESWPHSPAKGSHWQTVRFLTVPSSSSSLPMPVWHALFDGGRDSTKSFSSSWLYNDDESACDRRDRADEQKFARRRNMPSHSSSPAYSTKREDFAMSAKRRSLDADTTPSVALFMSITTYPPFP